MAVEGVFLDSTGMDPGFSVECWGDLGRQHMIL